MTERQVVLETVAVVGTGELARERAELVDDAARERLVTKVVKEYARLRDPYVCLYDTSRAMSGCRVIRDVKRWREEDETLFFNPGLFRKRLVTAFGEGGELVALPEDTTLWPGAVNRTIERIRKDTKLHYVIMTVPAIGVVGSGKAGQALLEKVRDLDVAVYDVPAATEFRKRQRSKQQSQKMRELLQRFREAQPVEAVSDAPATVAPAAQHAAVAELSPAMRVITRRDALLASGHLWDAKAVAQHARGGIVESNPSQYASRLRREGRLLGARFRQQYLHPNFQFNTANGEVHPRIADLLQQLPQDDTGWAAVFWCYHPSKALDGQTPAEIFPTDPVRVIKAAEKEFRRTDEEW